MTRKLIKDRGQRSRMNGDHARIFEEITNLKVVVAEIKKDTESIMKNFDDHLKRSEKVIERVRVLEAWRYRVLGATAVVGAVGFLAFINTIGIW